MEGSRKNDEKGYVSVCVYVRERGRERERVYMCMVEQVDVFVGKSVCECSRMGR